MTFLCAKDDFVVRTLNSLQGCWSRLLYAAQLRQPDGSYLHWGLARTHGAEKAQHAIEQAHRELFREALRLRMQEIAGQCSVSEAHAANEQKLALLPAGVSRAEQLHFNAVIFALLQLHNAKRPAA
jgi:hypothetical protein